MGAYIADRRKNVKLPNPSPRSNIPPYIPLLPKVHDLSHYSNNPTLPYPYPDNPISRNVDINKKTSISNLIYPPTLAPTIFTRASGLPYPYPTNSQRLPYPYPTGSRFTNNPKLPYPYPTEYKGYTNNPFLPYPYPTGSAYTNNPNLQYPYPTLNPTSVTHAFTNNPYLPTPYPPSQASSPEEKPATTSGNSPQPDVTPSKDAMLKTEDCAVTPQVKGTRLIDRL